ncbi:MAG: cell division protein FtsZ [Bacteroidetes bacterium]|nr:MAG: cell division protein FtsZ [Bacteroidota bacterium]
MINFDLPKNQSSDIKVLGVGGGGSNAVNYMFSQGIEGVDFIVCNTDSQALDNSPVPNKIQLGVSLTEGRGAGSIPAVGKNAAIEDIDRIKEILEKNTKMLFITAGMGGGTGTGAAPVIAQAAKEIGILTVGIVTIPFAFEGRKRRMQAEEGIKELKENVDALIVICNDKLRELYGNLSVTDAFSKADNVLTTAAKGIAEIITLTGGVNVDFADVKTVMSNSGVAIMGSGSAEGESRASKAVEMALASPLLNDNNIKGASNVLLNIVSGKEEILMDEITEITDYIQMEAGSTADIIWGYGKDENLGNKINVIIVATGFGENSDLGFNLEVKPAKKIVRTLDDTTDNKQDNEKTENDESGEMKLFTRKSGTGKSGSGSQNESEKSSYIFNFDVDTHSGKKDHSTDTNNEEHGFIRKIKADSKSSDTKSEPPLEDYDLRKKAIEREQRLRELSLKLKTPEGLQDVEKEPAYVRKNVSLNKVPASSESHVSRYTLIDEEGKTQIKSNNSFLHDNVD